MVISRRRLILRKKRDHEGLKMNVNNASKHNYGEAEALRDAIDEENERIAEVLRIKELLEKSNEVNLFGHYKSNFITLKFLVRLIEYCIIHKYIYFVLFHQIYPYIFAVFIDGCLVYLLLQSESALR